MQIQIHDLSFTYEGGWTPVFEHLSLSIDTSWRLGLIGRNGRGKTTFLHLLDGSLPGGPSLPLSPVYFPFPVPYPELCAMDLVPCMDPETPLWRFEREARQLRLEERLLSQPFMHLSRGEQTRVLLALLFAREDVWPLIDEPTNHLDADGRRAVAEYLKHKPGFLLVSHDRAFLNACLDHVMSLNRSDVWVMQGNFDTFQARMDLQTQTERAKHRSLEGEIRRLEASARQAERWSQRAETGKFHVASSEQAALDRGFVGARAAASMKKSKNTLRRREAELEEKQTLLKNVEHEAELRLEPLRHPKDVLISLQGGQIRYGDRVVADGIRLELRQGECLAVSGPNGCGKSSLLHSILGTSGALSGDLRLAPNLIFSPLPQTTEHLKGSIDELAEASDIDGTRLRAILRCMGCGREIFDQELQHMSEGQRKKVMIARSLCIPAHIYVWDEPLNFVDVISRMQLEQLICDFHPTMLLVEHDRSFLENISARIVPLHAHDA